MAEKRSLRSDDNMRRAVFGAQFVGLHSIGPRLCVTHPPLMRLVWNLPPLLFCSSGTKTKNKTQLISYSRTVGGRGGLPGCRVVAQARNISQTPPPPFKLVQGMSREGRGSKHGSKDPQTRGFRDSHGFRHHMMGCILRCFG